MISIRDCTCCPLQKKKIWVGISTVSQVQQWHKPHFWLTNKFVKHCIFFPSFLAILLMSVKINAKSCGHFESGRIKSNTLYTLNCGKYFILKIHLQRGKKYLDTMAQYLDNSRDNGASPFRS